jgi:hypothetical protein
VWGWIKKWFDPITTSKIFILSSHQVLPTLTSFINIEDIPKKYGGKLDFECGQLPVLDPQVRACLDILPIPDAETYFLSAPVRWVEAGEDGEMTAVSVGSIDGKERKEPIATLHSLAVRVATHSSHLQRQRSEIVVPNSRPITSHSQATSSMQALKDSQPVPPNQATPSDHPATVQPAPLTQTAPSNLPATIQPAPGMNASSASLHSQPIPAGGPLQHPLANGGPPERIAMPPPPTQIQRTKTEYVTPAEDPAEIKQLA